MFTLRARETETGGRLDCYCPEHGNRKRLSVDWRGIYLHCKDDGGHEILILWVDLLKLKVRAESHRAREVANSR